MSFELPDLDYKYSALEPYIDAKTMEIHHKKHHAGYVDKLNKSLEKHESLLELDISVLLKSIDKASDEIRDSVINNGGGHYNHSLFWKTMSEKPAKEPKGELKKQISKEFGTFAKFKEKFKTIALGQFGSGWGWLSVEGTKLTIESTANQNSPIMTGKIPILGIDVWEHAYYLKYQNKRFDYIDNWWNVVDWKHVEDNYNKALRS